MRRLIGIFLVIAVAIGLLTAPALAGGQVVLTAKAGFDSYGKISTYVPVVVWLANQGDGTSGEVVVRSRDASGFGVEYVMPAEVAQGAKKEIRFYVPVNEMTRNIDIVFKPTGKGDEVAAKAQINTLPYNEIMVGVLASDPTTLNHIGAVRLDNPPRSVRVVHLDETSMPDQQLALANFDMLVINDFDTTKLTQAQIDAIRGWLVEGGTLVVGGGPAWQKTLARIPEEFLPVKLTGAAQMSNFPALAALGGAAFQVMAPFAVNTGSLKEGAAGVVSGDRIGRATMNFGDGQTIFYGLDLALDPVAAWRGNQVVWQNILAGRAPQGVNAELTYKMSMRMASYRGGLANALRNIPALDLPPVWVLAVILLAYIIIVGPINYLVLKKRDRRDWGWLTIPVIALLVIAIVYVGAFKLKGREVMANEISVVSLRPDLRLQKIESYIGVFSPTRNDYRITMPGSPLITNVPSYDGMYYDPMANGEQMPLIMRVIYGSKTDVQFMNMSNWSLRSFTTQRYASAPGGIEAQLYGFGNRIAGTVTNKTQYMLTDCSLLTQYGLQSIGDLAPGATVNVELDTAADPKSPMPAFYRVSNPGATFQGGPGKVPPIPTRDQIRKRSVLDGAFDGGPDAGGQFSGVKFIGWTVEPLGEPIVTAGRVSRSSLAIVTQSLPYTTWQNGKYSLPVGLITPNLVEQSGNEVGWYSGGFHVANGAQLTLDFRLPEFRAMTVEKLLFNAQVDGSPVKSTQGTTTLRLEIYNFSRGVYENLDLNSVTDTNVPSPAMYVSPSGVVRMRVVSSQGQWINVQRLTLSVQGREAR